jgi:predicted Zn-dependent protease with MMP-like domain
MAMAEPSLLAPDADAIEALARAALARLPEPFAAHLDGVLLRIEDFAEQEVLDELGIEDPFDLSGLYTGRPIGDKSVSDSGAMPDMIHLYRRPLLDEWIETGVALDALITHVVIHEVGHHFGLSDDDMHALEAAAE